MHGILIWGRMNPPTIGHEFIINEARRLSIETGGEPILVLSKSHDKKKNPIPYEKKMEFVSRAWPDIRVIDTDGNHIVAVLSELDDVYTHLTLVSGSDRNSQYERIVTNYNGKDFFFTNINIHTIGNRDMSEGINGMSASKLRQYVVEDNFNEFKKGLPENLVEDAHEIFDILKAEMELEEELLDIGIEDLNEEGLSVTQRVRKGAVMRRYKSKLKVARRRAMKRRAAMNVIRKRARRGAIGDVKKKLARGKKLSDLSYGERNRVEAMTKRRKALVDRIARRKINDKRIEDRKRLGEVFDMSFLNDDEKGNKCQTSSSAKDRLIT